MTGRLVTLDLHHAEALENFLVDFDANPSELHAYFCDRNATIETAAMAPMPMAFASEESTRRLQYRAASRRGRMLAPRRPRMKEEHRLCFDFLSDTSRGLDPTVRA